MLPSGRSSSRSSRPMTGESASSCASTIWMLAALELGEVEQVVDGDLVLDDAEDRAGRADHLVDRELAEELLVLRVVDAGDRARDVEPHLRDLAGGEVHGVVAGDGGHHVGAAHAGLRLVSALAAVVGDDDAAQLVGDLARAGRVLLDDDDLVPGGEQLLGQVVADVAAADDHDVHRYSPPSLAVARLDDVRFARLFLGNVQRGLGRFGRRAGGGAPCSGLSGGWLDEAVRRLGSLERGHHEGVAEDDRATDRLEAEGAVRLAAERVVDLGDHARRAERVLGQLGGQSVAVVALGQRHDDVGLLGAGARMMSSSVPLPRTVSPPKPGGSRLKARGLMSMTVTFSPRCVELRGDAGSDAAAADDDDPHGVCASSFVSARRHQTGAVELRMTYGTVRPASHCPPNRFL